MSVVDRIKEYIEYKNSNKSRFYKETGLSNGFLDKVKDIGSSKIEIILKTYPDINPIWLITGQGSMLKDVYHLEKPDKIRYEASYQSDKHSDISLTRVGLRLDEIANKFKLSLEELADKINVDYAELLKMVSGEIEVPESLLDKIESVFPQIDRLWLHTGRGSMLKKGVKADTQESNVQATQVFRRRTDRLIDTQDIPLYDIRSLAGLSPIFNGQKTVPIDTLRIPNLPKVDGAVFVTGDSMYPVLKSGDIIVLKKINDIPDGILWGEIYLLDIDLSGDDMVTVKYVQRSEKGDEWLKLVSQNEHHQPKDIHLKKVRAMAHVKASVRFHTML